MTLRSSAKVALLSLAAFLRATSQAEVSLPPVTIVVYNSAVPESAELGRFYAQKRGIARDHIVALTCSTEEEISREEYDATIAQPLREVFKQRKWWTLRNAPDGQSPVVSNTIRFLALIKGMPLKIRGASNYPGDQTGPGPVANHNEASVDSELSTLAFFTRKISGALINPYFQSYRPITEFADAPLMLVCRLDAPSASTVRQMIIDAVEAEKTGLWGRAYVDGAHNTQGGLVMGDQWLAEIPEQLHRAGIPMVFDDTPALFPDGFPMTDCALYFGWYSGAVAGPFTQPEFRFVPGAVAVHIHSFSASTLRNEKANWVAPLLTKGAAATVGNVYEPYLVLTSHLNILS
ncbi:MAG: TIGR03790 family protein, partial [Verrucomicrobiota bacterium]|nr:TIGR03790 family protein [Verrucomicrobiota bacterium]